MSKSLKQIIKNTISTRGALPLDKYMEICLYHPELGYYTQKHTQSIGKKGDFFTSVSVGKTYGELLSYAVVKLFRYGLETKKNQPAELVELGANDGTLAFDIISSLKKNFPNFYRKATYFCLEKNQNLCRLIQEKASAIKEKKINLI